MKKVLLLIVFIVIIITIFVSIRPRENGTAALPRGETGSSRLSELLSEQGMEGYARATEARAFAFPEDHGPHPEYRNEWWYVTGNLDAEGGERFGFELTIFRFSLTPEQNSRDSMSSAWRSNQIYVGHFAVTDAENGQFHVAQRYARDSLGLAGAQASPFRVWLEDWSMAAVGARPDRRSSVDTSDTWRIHASDKEIAIDLTVVPLKPPVKNGMNGLSQKSSEPGNASYYYSISRLQTDGTLRVNGADYAVTGLSWLDREWGSSALSRQQQGWDWFALQLSDDSELMFYKLRRLDGSQDTHSAGTWVTANGETRVLSGDDVVIDVLDYWQSPHGGRYPMAWQMQVSPLALNLQVEPVLKTQELSATVRYWEGAVDVSGERAGSRITGRGYVELTGYAD